MDFVQCLRLPVEKLHLVPELADVARNIGQPEMRHDSLLKEPTREIKGARTSVTGVFEAGSDTTNVLIMFRNLPFNTPENNKRK